MDHVQGHTASGHRLKNEENTTIVALMRGGEPMAFGVSAVYPKVRFVHASCASDLKAHHLENQKAVILVDSVVNSGKSVIEFIDHVRKLNDGIRIVVVAGVVQKQAAELGHVFHGVLRRFGISLVALRLSENKFTGSKGTDTGNRLFNSTHLA